MPANFQFVGLIKLILPQARIISCTRDPVDTCFSIYKNFFFEEQPHAYDLEELAAFYNLYSDLMAHWHRVLPGFVFDIGYEKLVAAQEEKTRHLLEFCGLPWDPACLEFHKTEKAVKTASAFQVRQPLYKTSVATWKNYEAYLAPLVTRLRR